MTLEEIIDMANQTDFSKSANGIYRTVNLMTFAKLVAEAEKERIAKKIEKLPFGDTAQSFAIWVRNDT